MINQQWTDSSGSLSLLAFGFELGGRLLRKRQVESDIRSLFYPQYLVFFSNEAVGDFLGKECRIGGKYLSISVKSLCFTSVPNLPLCISGFSLCNHFSQILFLLFRSFFYRLPSSLLSSFWCSNFQMSLGKNSKISKALMMKTIYCLKLEVWK